MLIFIIMLHSVVNVFFPWFLYIFHNVKYFCRKHWLIDWLIDWLFLYVHCFVIKLMLLWQRQSIYIHSAYVHLRYVIQHFVSICQCCMQFVLKFCYHALVLLDIRHNTVFRHYSIAFARQELIMVHPSHLLPTLNNRKCYRIWAGSIETTFTCL